MNRWKVFVVVDVLEASVGILEASVGVFQASIDLDSEIFLYY
jgi:hypothetical protein